MFWDQAAIPLGRAARRIEREKERIGRSLSRICVLIVARRVKLTQNLNPRTSTEQDFI